MTTTTEAATRQATVAAWAATDPTYGGPIRAQRAPGRPGVPGRDYPPRHLGDWPDYPTFWRHQAREAAAQAAACRADNRPVDALGWDDRAACWRALARRGHTQTAFLEDDDADDD